MGRLNATVLGAAAGGGYPQWNCRCAVCRLAWDGDCRVFPSTQASVAVSADADRWLLINASPDLRFQIANTAVLHPRGERRDTPITGVVLSGAEIDQTAGLLSLRERQPLTVHATSETLAALAANPMFDVLAPDVVTREAVMLDEPFHVADMEITLFAVPGKAPLYLEGDTPELAVESGVNVGVAISAQGARLVYVPGCAAASQAVMARLARADVVLFDGTLFSDDEMIRTRTGTKSGRRMGHMPIDGADGSLAALSGVTARRIYIHINNTNPILVKDSPERRRVVAAGWGVATDGMEIAL